MFGIVLATLNESFAMPWPIAATSSSFHRKPVIRLISDAIAIRPDAFAMDGAFAGAATSSPVDGLTSGPRGIAGMTWVASASYGRMTSGSATGQREPIGTPAVRGMYRVASGSRGGGGGCCSSCHGRTGAGRRGARPRCGGGCCGGPAGGIACGNARVCGDAAGSGWLGGGATGTGWLGGGPWGGGTGWRRVGCGAEVRGSWPLCGGGGGC